MPRTYAGRVIALVALTACRPEYVVGEVLSEDASTSGTSTSATAEPSTSSSTTVDASSSSSGGSESSTSTGMEVCEAPQSHVPCDADVSGDDHEREVMRVIGLDCPGEPGETMPVVEVEFSFSDYTTWTTPGAYGNAEWSASEGDRLLVLTTGRVEHTEAAGTVTLAEGSTEGPGGANGNVDQVATLPTPIVPQPGSADGNGGTPFENCDDVGDCSDTLPPVWSADADGADDMMWLRFSLDVPAGTHGWLVDLAWFSAEFPERIATETNDIVVWWQSSEAFTGNVATLDGAALTVTSLEPHLTTSGFIADAPELVGTGYEGTTASPCGEYPDCPNGAATGWLTLAGPVMPGERVQMVLALFDLGDALVDTAVLVDRFRWDCEGCTPDGTDCGLAPR